MKLLKKIHNKRHTTLYIMINQFIILMIKKITFLRIHQHSYNAILTITTIQKKIFFHKICFIFQMILCNWQRRILVMKNRLKNCIKNLNGYGFFKELRTIFFVEPIILIYQNVLLIFTKNCANISM